MNIGGESPLSSNVIRTERFPVVSDIVGHRLLKKGKLNGSLAIWRKRQRGS